MSGVRFIIDSFWAAKARGALEMRFWEMGGFFCLSCVRVEAGGLAWGFFVGFFIQF